MAYPVEIKANVEPDHIDAALTALGLTDPDAEPRSIYFLETRDAGPGAGAAPSLYAQGVILRLRRDVDSADCTAKLRPCQTSRLPRRWRSARKDDRSEYRLEKDWTGVDPVLSASLVIDVDAGAADAALRHGDAAGLIDADQQDLLAGYTSRPLPTSDLRLLGPVRARKWKVKVDGHKINCEEWVLGARVRFLELSGREDEPAQAAATREELFALYARHGVRVSATPELKTKLVLDYFS